MFQGSIMRFDSAGAEKVFLRALLSGLVIQGRTDGARFRQDADVINLLRDFTARLGKVYEDKFADLRALEFVPMADVPVSATTTAFIGEFLSRVGKARIITEVSTDIPIITMKGQTFTGRIATLAAAGMWSQEDIARAAVGNVNIPVKTQQGAREAIETEIDNLVALGDSTMGIPGFLRHPDVTTIPLNLGNWSTRTLSQIVDDVHAWVNAQNARVNFIERSRINTLILPPTAKNVLLRKRTTLETENAWNIIEKELREAHGITIDTWSKLETAGAGGAARMVGYRRDPDCVGAIVPLEYLQFNPQEQGLNVMVPAMAKTGGTLVIEPATLAYSDNTLS